MIGISARTHVLNVILHVLNVIEFTINESKIFFDMQRIVNWAV